MTLMFFDEMLPLIFIGLMGVSLLVYVVSDGYDLGVGMLMHRATPEERDTMVASIGPFWDANETWLVLGVGLLLVAFPKAHGLVLSELYLPTALMLVGLVLRGAAFDFRVKAKTGRKAMWDRMFIAGSMLASVCQGWMLGRYISGFGDGWNYPIFAGAIAAALPMAYALLGATWLVMKAQGELQEKAIEWSKIAWAPMVLGLILISMATPWISETVRVRWFTLPAIIAVAAIPITSGRCAAGSSPSAGDASRARGTVLAALRAAGPGLLPELPRAQLQHLSVCRDRPAHGLAGRQQPGVAEGDPDRGLRDTAGHHRLHRIFLSRIPRQGHRVGLCVSRRPQWPVLHSLCWFRR
ncbi:cytochrome bd-type quinol oxidase subunit 2 [Bradyrhizobium diazoefficiens]